MCRHVGYIGTKKLLCEPLINKKHSLKEMAYKPKEMLEAYLNVDGFGIGWCSNKSFYAYKNTCPIWNDSNLDSVSKNIKSDLIIGNVRSATIINNSGNQNTHPFFDDNFMFSHNGYIKSFDENVKEKFLDIISPDFLKLIKGNTDSEYIFTLFRQNFFNLNNIIESLNKTIAQIVNLSQVALLNLLIATKFKGEKKMIATKYGHNATPPSLYYQCNKDKKENIISSEKMSSVNWKKVPDNSLIEITKNKKKIVKIFK